MFSLVSIFGGPNISELHSVHAALPDLVSTKNSGVNQHINQNIAEFKPTENPRMDTQNDGALEKNDSGFSQISGMKKRT